MEPFRYRVQVNWSDEDEAYVARVPSIPGCMAHGENLEAATSEVHAAAELMLSVMRDHGDPIPPEDGEQEYSGNIRLRLPRSLHARLGLLAQEEGVSLNQLMVSFLAEGAGYRRGMAAGAQPIRYSVQSLSHDPSLQLREGRDRPPRKPSTPKQSPASALAKETGQKKKEP